MDRGVFANLAPELQTQIGWTQDQYWYMQVVFQAAYAVSNLLAGRLMDVMGLRWGFTLACIFWGLAAMSHSLVSTVAGFFVCRILLGLGEGGNFPAANKANAEWFPKRERALAFALLNSGSNVGSIIVPFCLPLLMPFMAEITFGGHTLGWRGAFLVTGIFDLGWIIAWLLMYGKPEGHPKVSAAELALINSDPPEPTVKIPWGKLLPHRQMWAFAARQIDRLFLVVLFVRRAAILCRPVWPDPENRSLPVALIYVAATFTGVGGGWLSGYFMKRGWSLNKARKITMLICAAAIVPVIYAAFTDSQWVAVGLIALACSAHQAWSCNVMSLAGDMFPRRVVGSVTGLAGFAGSAAGIVLFTWVGLMRKAAIARGETGNYVPIFIVAGVTYLITLLCAHLLAPKLDPAEVEEKPQAV